MSYLLAVLGCALGAAALVHGERDDSPGLMLIGVVVATAAVLSALRRTRRRA